MAIIGCNNMGKKHLDILQNHFSDDVEIVGILNSTLESSKKKANELGVDYFETADAINSENVDAVIISTPATYHAKYAIEMLEKGIDVLLEKPFANTQEECLEVVKAADVNNRILMIGYTELFNPATIYLQKAIAGKNIKSVDAYRSSIGIGGNFDITMIQNLIIHDMSVFQSISGVCVGDITDMNTFSHPKKDSSHYSKISAKFGDDLIVNMIGEDSLERVRTMNVIDEYDNKYDVDFASRSLSINGKLVSEGGDSLYNEHAHFIDCIKNRKEPVGNGKDAMNIEGIISVLNDDFLKTYEKDKVAKLKFQAKLNDCSK